MRDVDDLHGAWERRINPERRAACQVRHYPRLPLGLLVLRVLLLLALLALSVTAFAVLSRGPAPDVARSVMYRTVAWPGKVWPGGDLVDGNDTVHSAATETAGMHVDL